MAVRTASAKAPASEKGGGKAEPTVSRSGAKAPRTPVTRGSKTSRRRWGSGICVTSRARVASTRSWARRVEPSTRQCDAQISGARAGAPPSSSGARNAPIRVQRDGRPTASASIVLKSEPAAPGASSLTVRSSAARASARACSALATARSRRRRRCSSIPSCSAAAAASRSARSLLRAAPIRSRMAVARERIRAVCAVACSLSRRSWAGSMEGAAGAGAVGAGGATGEAGPVGRAGPVVGSGIGACETSVPDTMMRRRGEPGLMVTYSVGRDGRGMLKRVNPRDADPRARQHSTRAARSRSSPCRRTSSMLEAAGDLVDDAARRRTGPGARAARRRRSPAGRAPGRETGRRAPCLTLRLARADNHRGSSADPPGAGPAVGGPY